MQFQPTPLKDCFVVTPDIFKDHRGIFMEAYHKEKFKEATGLDIEFVQDNQSVSKKGVLRGLHFQAGDFAQAKLVRVIYGEVMDVVVDLRQDSPTFKKVHKIILNEENQHQLFVPQGFAHGFITLSETSVFSYKCDRFYYPGSEYGIIYNDPSLAIDWGFLEEKMILSEKDLKLPTLKEFFQ
ncbi:dTDP-4-dehydrorhamnose 3,5-epimerase [Gillisia limnaea]|uniref:dTDP-4-dehydrorhamnose 3,5-epimerase n=1 Tax=Gillisia limnaea (strain DSM 15749 / LMG 21470 / R-8282) TaxID=865937 RepID=H2BUB4_GILLR|nr:dTDP-4-dehydrorhamnose 3,5-epimerase [Gillisia limnaea]EHQ02748.1 dTDP-4-dehydrorhamnose 3,5-epimerase [Gillisia limnaea DSM 15749]